MDSGSSSAPMASSSKQTNELVVKESDEFDFSNLDLKTEALYAFRTITTMLSLIHSTRGKATGNRSKPGRGEKELLQLLDAFAAVLLRNNGVIAVTAQPYDGSGIVEVLASYFHNEEPLIISQPASVAEHFMHLLRNTFVVQNPRDFTVKKQGVVDPETSVPQLYKGISDRSKLLNTFLTHTW